MKLIVALSLIIIVLTLYSCEIKNHKKELPTISGTISGIKDNTRIFLSIGRNTIINSALVKAGKFEMTFTLDEVPAQVFLYITIDNDKKMRCFYMDTTSIIVNGDINQMEKIKISGSKYNDEIEAYNEYIRKRFGNIDSLFSILSYKKDEGSKKVISELLINIANIEALNLNLMKSYIRTHPNSFASLLNLAYSCDDIRKDSLTILYMNLAPELKTMKQAAEIYDYITKSNAPEVGDRFTDFEAFDKTGKKHLLSEIKGKYILLDFTRVSCGACCEAMSDLAIFHKKYDKQLTILSFSSDIEKKDWLDGIKEYKVEWLSLWDGKGIESPIYKKYVDGGMPQFYLINPKGFVVKKWKGYGHEYFLEKLRRYCW